MALRIDIETYSDLDLLDVGVYKYSSHPSFEILMIAFKDGDLPVQMIDIRNMNNCSDREGQEAVLRYFLALCRDDAVIKKAFNANFERVCLNAFYNLEMDARAWECTMVKAQTLGLPNSLAKVGEALELPADKLKQKRGKALISHFCKPKNPSSNNGRKRNLPSDDPSMWEEFKEYCIQDVIAEEAIDLALEPHDIRSKFEHDLYVVDQRINDRGVRIDRQLAEMAVQIDKASKEPIIDNMKKITGLNNPASLTQLKDWVVSVSDYDVHETGLGKERVQEIIDETDNMVLKQVLEMRQETSNSSTAKYAKMLEAMCDDDRVRGIHLFYGANRTGRWAGRLIQGQNLPRNHMKDINTAREMVKFGSFRALNTLYDDPSDVLKQLIRTAIIPEPGKRLYICDFSAIEARVLAHEAQESWRMDIFNTHGKIYEASAAQMFHVPIETIVKGGENYNLRAKGKVAELALGYGGSVGALIAFGADKMGMKEEEMKPLVDTWRAANRKITSYWWDIGEAAVKAVENPGMAVPARGVTYQQLGPILFCTLRSGSRLAYVQPRIIIDQYNRKQIEFKGMHQTKKRWTTIQTYGPKLVENIIQRLARDCLGFAMLNIEKFGYEIHMHVHDEVVIELSDKDVDPDMQLENIERIMGIRPEWAPDLPLKGDGFYTDYYMKD